MPEKILNGRLINVPDWFRFEPGFFFYAQNGSCGVFLGPQKFNCPTIWGCISDPRESKQFDIYTLQPISSAFVCAIVKNGVWTLEDLAEFDQKWWDNLEGKI